MKVILRKSVPRLGRAGEMAQVSNGYARNYLIPQGLAYVATDGNVKVAQLEAQKQSAEEEKQRAQQLQVAEKLEGVSVTVSAHAGEEGKLFGSVSAQNIVDALKEQGYDIEKRQIDMDAPIKELGVFPVKIYLTSNVTAEIRIWVVKG